MKRKCELSIMNTLPTCIHFQMGHFFMKRCSIDPLTTVLENGESQRARFYFKAFRFIEQQNETVSTYYLHCITRLWERNTCSTFKVPRAFQAEMFYSSFILGS